MVILDPVVEYDNQDEHIIIDDPPVKGSTMFDGWCGYRDPCSAPDRGSSSSAGGLSPPDGTANRKNGTTSTALASHDSAPSAIQHNFNKPQQTPLSTDEIIERDRESDDEFEEEAFSIFVSPEDAEEEDSPPSRQTVQFAEEVEISRPSLETLRSGDNWVVATGKPPHDNHSGNISHDEGRAANSRTAHNPRRNDHWFEALLAELWPAIVGGQCDLLVVQYPGVRDEIEEAFVDLEKHVPTSLGCEMFNQVFTDMWPAARVIVTHIIDTEVGGFWKSFWRVGWSFGGLGGWDHVGLWLVLVVDRSRWIRVWPAGLGVVQSFIPIQQFLFNGMHPASPGPSGFTPVHALPRTIDQHNRRIRRLHTPLRAHDNDDAHRPLYGEPCVGIGNFVDHGPR